MPDQGTVEKVASKFQQWAESLSADEQETLAEWWSAIRNDDVSAHSADWWKADGAWSKAWADSWSW